MAAAEAQTSLRLPQDLLDRADLLVGRLGDTTEALAAGGRWGRAAVLRLALARGLAELEADAAGGSQ